MPVQLYKGNDECIANVDQLPVMLNAGWSRSKSDAKEVIVKADAKAKAKADAKAKAKADAKAKAKADAKAKAKADAKAAPKKRRATNK